MAIQDVTSIIFDLGGVIIDIDTSRSFQKLSSFYTGDKPGEDLLSENVELFLDFEKGLISSDDFRSGIRRLTENSGLSDSEIDAAWNEMLLQIPAERFRVLENIRDRYQLFVLSNTNAIHVPALNKIVEQTSGKPDIAHFFDKVYFSHEIQKRKPEPEIYRQLLDENQLTPQQTLFIDDRRENIEAASSLGMQVFHVTPEMDIVEFFSRT
jgi:putative hydrolase of the HAD superfamily